MLELRILPNKQLWWIDPPKKKEPRMPGKRKRAQEVDYTESLRKILKPRLPFEPSRRWIRYSDIPYVDRGYITELYNLRSVQTRYGLSQMTARYWRQFILPESFEVSNVKNVRAFYWSRIQLVVLDTALRWQESNGILTIRKTDTELLDLISNGCKVLEEYYSVKYEEQSLFGKSTKLGVRFIE